MGDIINKAAALDPRYHGLKYLSEEQNERTWKLLEEEIKKNTIVKVNHTNENKTKQQSEQTVEESKDTFDKPRSKKRRLYLLADSDDEDNDFNDYEDTEPDESLQQLKRYRQLKETVPKSIDPLVWWKANGHKFPNIANLAKKYLCIVATSVPCERLFSQAGQVISQKRARLTSNRVNGLLFLNAFLRSEEQIQVSTVNY